MSASIPDPYEEVPSSWCLMSLIGTSVAMARFEGLRAELAGAGSQDLTREPLLQDEEYPFTSDTHCNSLNPPH